MPQNVCCERCLRAGVVRMERIITGITVTLEYHCGACGHSWKWAAPNTLQPARVSLKPKKDRRQSA
jgi:hypothetical protein